MIFRRWRWRWRWLWTWLWPRRWSVNEQACSTHLTVTVDLAKFGLGVQIDLSKWFYLAVSLGQIKAEIEVRGEYE